MHVVHTEPKAHRVVVDGKKFGKTHTLYNLGKVRQARCRWMHTDRGRQVWAGGCKQAQHRQESRGRQVHVGDSRERHGWASGNMSAKKKKKLMY